MSLFNKPKRNIRRRPFNDEDEDNENRMEVEDAQPVKIKTKKKDKPKQTRLSFGEELEQGVYTHTHTLFSRLLCDINQSLFAFNKNIIICIEQGLQGHVCQCDNRNKDDALIQLCFIYGDSRCC